MIRLRMLCHGAAVAATLALGTGVQVQAQTPPPKSMIYSCVDSSGKRITSDRPIVECSTVPQNVLRGDGSVMGVRNPTPTTDERAEIEARERQELIERTAKQDAIRRDRNLLLRFPHEAAHQKARANALADINKSRLDSEARLAALARERKPMNDEAEFYTPTTMPTKLRTQLDTNDALADAQRALVQNTGAEITRINQLYDMELVRLKKLWAGATPGSMGTLAAGAPASAASR